MTSSYANGTLTLDAAGGTEDALPLAGGTMEGDIDMDGNAVTGLPTPTADSDATPKSYADTKYTKPSGGIPASDLASAVQTSLGLADSALQSVPSTYRTATVQDTIDAAQNTNINSKLPLAGGIMSGNINMDSNKVTNLPTPTANGDAVNKSYVDSNYRTATAQDTIDEAQDAKIETISHRNLLDNWYFVGGGSQLGEGVFPLNQKGQTAYTASGITIDRWKSSASSISCTVNSGNVLVKATAASAQWYQILSNQGGLAGKKVTLSALTATNVLVQTTVDIPSTIPSGTQTIGSGTGDVNGYSLYVRTISGKLAAVVYAGSSFSSAGISLIAVKLEIGSNQTLAHLEGTNWVLNAIPDYGDELAKCQRYLLPVTTDAFFVGTTGVNHTNPTFFVPTPVTMAKNPTTSSSIVVNAQHGSGYVNNVTVTVSSCIAAPNGVRINTTGSTAIGTANYAMCLIQSKNTIYLSAES